MKKDSNSRRNRKESIEKKGINMIKAEINEIRALFSSNLTDCGISRIAGCYVNGDKKKVMTYASSFLTLPEEEQYKYLEIFRKTMSGSIGKNLFDMEFSHDEGYRNEAQDFLMELKMSKLEDEKLIEAFYDKVIETYNYVGNYLIILIFQSYDVPGITSDNIEMEDASEEVYDYLLCSICPVKLSKPGLGYDAYSNGFHNLQQNNMVELTQTGFLFPAFTERSADIDRILYYTKNTADMQQDFIDLFLKCHVPMAANQQKETFNTLIEETLGDDGDYDTIKHIHENLAVMHREKKSDGEELILDKDRVKDLFKVSGVPDEKLENFDETFEKSFEIVNEKALEKKVDEAMKAGEEHLEDVHIAPVEEKERVFRATNVMAQKTFDIKTPEVVVKINSDNTDLVEERIIDGKKCLVIKLTEGIVVNGIPVRLYK